MHRFALSLFLPIVLLCQTAPKPEEHSVVAGRVLNAVTGEPLAKAALTLARIDQKTEQSNWEQSYNATSGASGGFSFRDIAPGRYRLQAQRNGFPGSRIRRSRFPARRSGAGFDPAAGDPEC